MTDNPLLAAALEYAAAGLEVFPVREADKAPYTTHGMRDATTDADTITRWWTEFPRALVGCRIPDDVVVLDVDPRHGGGRTWLELERQHNPIVPGRCHASGRNDGGRHNWFEKPDGKLSIRPLNEWARRNGCGQAVNGSKWTAGVDILHHGHRYTILPPSPHPETSKPYRWLQEGKPEPMPAWLAELVVEPEREAPILPPVTPHEGDSIADWYSQTSRWCDILAGWTLVKGDGESDGSQWRHPTATAASSASVKHGCLFVYSPNAGLDETEQGDPHGYTKFRAWAELHHDGDLKRAASVAHERRDRPRDDLTYLTAELHTAAPVAPHQEPPTDAYDDDLRALLVDWGDFWNVDHNAEEWLIRPIIAAKRSHAMFAPGGTGKSLLALWVSVMAATGKMVFGEAQRPIRVLYLDYEMTAADLAERLDSMGFGSDCDLTNLHYSLLPSLPGLDAPEGGKAVVRLAQLVDAELVVIDTFGRAVHGDENDADTVRNWYRWTGLHLKAEGRAFLRVDHAGKDVEKGQRGTSAKNDDVDVVWQMARDGDHFTLKAKKRRMGWVPESVKLERREEPELHYALTDGGGYPEGTRGVIDALDRLGVDPATSNRAAGEALRAAGEGAKASIVRAAQNYRRRAVDNAEIEQLYRVPESGRGYNCSRVPEAGRTPSENGQNTSVDPRPDVRDAPGRGDPSPTGGACVSIRDAPPGPAPGDGTEDIDELF